uniref:Uncharacterized protein n=1 Tax=Panagrolaimus superbus TaxID=310955 RepID=A0A914XVK5_9BILA
MDKHLLAIANFRQSLYSKPLKNVINVYTENDKAEVNRCVDAILRLEARVNQIREEFPEEANLKEISEIITTFLNADCGVPQMKLASWIEKVLEKCEHWQKLAPRQYSLVGQLNELQQILIDWRKMQVHSWNHIINAVQEESQAIAVTMGYPIIQTLMQWRQNPTAEKNIQNFLAMIVDWIQSSTLIDFESRLKIASFAAVLIDNFSKSDTKLYELSPSIKSIVFYFSAYLQTVQEKLKKKRAEVVQELENFVNIVKFHDLNLWSVKNSAEKAHQKLFKIIKRYKLHGNEQLSTLFLTFLPEIPCPLSIEISTKLTDGNSESRLNFANFFERFSNLLNGLPGLIEPESLFEYCSDYLGILKKDVIYAENDDEGNEKLQGQALFDRQRRFAALVKQASKFGLRSRRAAPISSEELLKSSLTMDAKNTGLNEEYFRSCAVTRNLVIRLVNQLNSTKQPHILKQVSAQMISHIRGVTEYGFAWLLNSVPTFQRLEETIQWIQATKDRISIFAENAKISPPCFSASSQSKSIFDEAKGYVKKSFEIGKLLQSLIFAAPEKSINSTFNADVNILSELRDVALHKEHPKIF